MSEFEPVPQASGSLDPPRRRPPTAVGAATPGPAPRPRRGSADVEARLRRPPPAVRLAAQVLGATLGTAAGLARQAVRLGKRVIRTGLP